MIAAVTHPGRKGTVAMRTMQIAAVAAVLAGAAAGLAGPASAEQLNGPYTRTVTDNGGGPFNVGGQTPWILSPCGTDCLHVHQAADPEFDMDMHLQGTAWTGTVGEHRTTSFDKNTLLGTDTLDNGSLHFVVSYTLTKG